MSQAELNRIAASLGMKVSQAWNGSSAEQKAYAEKHAQTGRMFMADQSDVQIASRVRMLYREDLDHEAIVTAARDRICALVVERDALLASIDVETLEAVADEIDCFEHSARAAGLRGIAKRQRAAVAQAGGAS